MYLAVCISVSNNLFSLNKNVKSRSRRVILTNTWKDACELQRKLNWYWNITEAKAVSCKLLILLKKIIIYNMKLLAEAGRI
jgi:hypothetical protein